MVISLVVEVAPRLAVAVWVIIVIEPTDRHVNHLVGHLLVRGFWKPLAQQIVVVAIDHVQHHGEVVLVIWAHLVLHGLVYLQCPCIPSLP